MNGRTWRHLFVRHRVRLVRAALFLHDALALTAAWFGAYWLRFGFAIPAHHWRYAAHLWPLVLAVQLLVFRAWGLHRMVIRFVSVPDLLKILAGGATANFLLLGLLFSWDRLAYLPRSILPLDFLLVVFFLGGGRFLYRLLREGLPGAGAGLRTLVVGAGQAGEQLVRDMLRQQGGPYRPVGFLDDDRGKVGREILGVRVLGRTRDLPEIARELGAEMVLLAIPSAGRRTLRRLTELCRETGLPYRTLPSLHDLMAGQVTVSALREVTVEDLLGRDPVQLDWAAIRAEVEGRRILVTGAGGSIGGELCRQIARLSPARLVLLDAGEYALYRIEMEIGAMDGAAPFSAVLADIRDRAALEAVFDRERPQVVFHAAAYKHVPLVELNPAAGVATNVFGTRTLAETADAFGVEKFVMVSTDKAVNPANVMGATKRVAEIFCQNLDARSRTAFITTRFGNVLGSSGSVVPLFQRQVARGGPVTVTHPEIERYFMTIPEASQLVLQATALGRGGEIFVLDMGEPVKIRELAEQVIRLSGLEPDRDIPIVYTGLRPGEKLYEELLHPDEHLAATAHPKILLARSREVDWAWCQAGLKRLEAVMRRGGPDEIRGALRALVPEYRPAPAAAADAAGS
ncbi:polysaccharide biosynthesis protein [Dissulfurirhabdus thermomarina]|uniref:Polysaccharide biosynthesis protein n=1 Tax=Dissulfurirhabdus thermomarina TaxID=1765737 RepID=A0A6N9TP61_DISTH|nr:nucleoside-diphosphate sugar epimerase/dehydratase [Dissulfurirhabdus thermomarina]NDY41883.1 polysaccharide biosynthesis protein [Dissulfurirhabdus thermomarina]NMX22584.1 polysaccharide biosynthesis protein [Dissulfurirhabdus thermomarina]